MTAFVTSGAVGPSTLLGQRLSNVATCSARPNTPSMSADAPPESRVAPFYPAKGRFLAPRLSLSAIEDCELMNMIQLDFSEVPLDLAEAARVKASIDAPFFSKDVGFHFSGLFSFETEDASAASVVDRYYPAERRNEIPVLSFEREDKEDDCSLKVEYGNLVMDKDVDDEPVEGSGKPAEGLPGVVRRAYGDSVRNIAPVIEFGEGELSISLSMKPITGTPDASLYPSKFNNCAPEILMKREAFDGDSSAFICVSSEEVQLTGLNAKL